MTTSKRNHAATYRFPTGSNENEQETICKTFFLHFTEYTKEKLRDVWNILNKFKTFVGTRGRDQVSQKSVLNKNSIRAFISNLRGKESH